MYKQYALSSEKSHSRNIVEPPPPTPTRSISRQPTPSFSSYDIVRMLFITPAYVRVCVIRTQYVNTTIRTAICCYARTGGMPPTACLSVGRSVYHRPVNFLRSTRAKIALAKYVPWLPSHSIVILTILVLILFGISSS